MSLVKLGLPMALQHELPAMPCEEPLDPLDNPCAVLLRCRQCAVELPAVFLLDAGHPHSTPHLPLAGPGTQEHCQELADIEPIRLGPAVMPIDLKTGRIEDAVCDAMGHEVTVQPEAITTRLIATHDACILGPAKALLRPEALWLSPCLLPRRDRPCTWRLRYAARKTSLPHGLPQFKRQEQRGLRWGLWLDTGPYGSSHRLTPP